MPEQQAAASEEDGDEALAAGLAPAVADYGLIGNCKSAALISRFGGIDWLCFPHFSGASFFGALLDRARGGHFTVRMKGATDSWQSYVPNTNILETHFVSPQGALTVTDFMPVQGEEFDTPQAQHELVRIARCTQGTVELEALFMPRPGYAAALPRLVRRGRLGWQCVAGGHGANLHSDLDFVLSGPVTLRAACTLQAGERRRMLLSYCENDVCIISPIDEAEHKRLSAQRWWEFWSARCRYEGPYREAVVRSVLTLKLLTYCISGAVVAAPTTSLPEDDSGARNWDYRYCWLRDASMVLAAFNDLGYFEESAAFMAWLLHATRLTRPRLQVLYDVFGEARLKERELPQWAGYRGIGPVRVGNKASEQLQLDVYGEVILAAAKFLRGGGRFGPAERGLIAGFAKTVCASWHKPDQSIWEIRLPARHNTYSKLMCWAALHAICETPALQTAELDMQALRRTMQQIRDDIEQHGYNQDKRSYVGYYGGSATDAALLLIPRIGFHDANETRTRETARRIAEELAIDGLLYRYPPGGEYDGVGGEEHLFVICSFWRVDYLAREGKLDEAHALMSDLLGHATPLGLYAEQIDSRDFSPRANFPQAFSHVGLITAAVSLSSAQHSSEELAS